MSISCVNCTRDLKDGYTCTSCATTLTGDLYTLAWLASELQVTRTRQARVAGGNGHGRPLGFNLAAATAYTQLHDMLTRWDMGPRSDTATVIALRLAYRDWTQSPYTDRLVNDVAYHTKHALEIINPLADEQTYGICGEEIDGVHCPAHLYGEANADWVRCRRCNTQHDARKRMAVLEQRMRVLYFRAATLARILPRLIERPVSASGIRNWVARDQPIKTRTDEDGHVEYHCGDVIEVAKRVATRDRPSKMTKEAS